MKRVLRGESGQVLILIALALIALMGFLALAVDVGVAYAERRSMQNAADAGALAGARALCSTGLDPYAEAEKFARANGAVTVTVEIEDNVVAVRAVEPVRFFFAGVLGEQFRQAEVPAVAASACGAATAGCWIWPIGLHNQAWDKAYLECGQEFVVMDTTKTCEDEGVICDLDGDGKDDIIMGGNRGWLNFGFAAQGLPGAVCANCGDMKCWIDDPFPGAIEPPICITGQAGSVNVAFQRAGNYVGEVRSIPVFDEVVDQHATCPNNDPEMETECNDPLYHVIDFACVRVKAYCKKNNNCSFRGSPHKFTEDDALVVEALCDQDACFQECSTTVGGSVGVSDPSAVSLIGVPDWFSP